MSSHGFPVLEEIKQQQQSNIFSDNTRSMILDMNNTNLSFFKLIFEKLSLLTAQMDDMRGKLDTIQFKLDTLQMATNNLQTTPPEPKTPTAKPKTITTTFSRVSSLKK